LYSPALQSCKDIGNIHLLYILVILNKRKVQRGPSLTAI